MIIILDASIIIAALLGSRGKIAILTSQNHKFYAPLFVVKEIKKYQQEISNKMQWTQEEFNIYFGALLYFIKIIEQKEYEKYMEKAQCSIERRDMKDADYIACALALNADFIWTEDKDFSDQDLVNIKNTAQFINDNR